MPNLWKLDSGFMSFTTSNEPIRRFDLKVLMSLVDLKNIHHTINIKDIIILNINSSLFIYHENFGCFANEKMEYKRC